jgi:hypothetical protein
VAGEFLSEAQTATYGRFAGRWVRIEDQRQRTQAAERDAERLRAELDAIRTRHDGELDELRHQVPDTAGRSGRPDSGRAKLRSRKARERPTATHAPAARASASTEPFTIIYRFTDAHGRR